MTSTNILSLHSMLSSIHAGSTYGKYSTVMSTFAPQPCYEGGATLNEQANTETPQQRANIPQAFFIFCVVSGLKVFKAA